MFPSPNKILFLYLWFQKSYHCHCAPGGLRLPLWNQKTDNLREQGFNQKKRLLQRGIWGVFKNILVDAHSLHYLVLGSPAKTILEIVGLLGRSISPRAGESWRWNYSSMNFNSVCNALTQDKTKILLWCALIPKGRYCSCVFVIPCAAYLLYTKLRVCLYGILEAYVLYLGKIPACVREMKAQIHVKFFINQVPAQW